MRIDRRISAAVYLALGGPLALGASLGAAVALVAHVPSWTVVTIPLGCLASGSFMVLRLRRLLGACNQLVDRACELRPRVRVLRALLHASTPVGAVDLVETARVRPMTAYWILSRLEARHLVAAVRLSGAADTDRGGVRYQLSEQGRCVARLWTEPAYRPSVWA